MSSIVSKRHFKNSSPLELYSGFDDEYRNVLVGKPNIFALKTFFFFMHYMFDRKLFTNIVGLLYITYYTYIII